MLAAYLGGGWLEIKFGYCTVIGSKGQETTLVAMCLEPSTKLWRYVKEWTLADGVGGSKQTVKTRDMSASNITRYALIDRATSASGLGQDQSRDPPLQILSTERRKARQLIAPPAGDQGWGGQIDSLTQVQSVIAFFCKWDFPLAPRPLLGMEYIVR